MKRRDFIATSALSTAALTTLVVASCDTPSAPGATTGPVEDLVPAFELDEESVGSLQEKMSTGAYTAEQITQLYLNRIAAIDQAGPKLNAVIELNPEALSIARSMDKERADGNVRSPLHGIPVLIKDNIDTADGMQTTAGALALEGNKATTDASVVKHLREAGAVILGKTNLSEWANFRSSNSCSGWSSRGGQTKNPYILDHNPCGSSSGSGVAVAANLCVVAVGTETDGSVTCPAAVNGIVGLKPTVGLVSRTGIIPISATQDTAGPMGRSVADVAALLGAMVGVDDADPITHESRDKAHSDYTKFLDRNGLKGKRIGIEKKPQGDDQYMHELQQGVIKQLIQLGAEIIEIEYLEEINKLGDAEFELMLYEFKEGVNKYLAASQSSVKTLAEVIAFNSQHLDTAMPYFKQEILERANKKSGLDTKEYLEALSQSHVKSREIIDEVLRENKLDAIGGLTMGPACSIDMIYGDRWGSVFLTMPAAITGYPHISIPCGRVHDLPVGFSFFGPPYTEPLLLAMAYAFEGASNHRKTPTFQKSFLA